MNKSPFLILASQSPRRKVLLKQAGYAFEVIPSEAEEEDATAQNVVEIVQENARLKGDHVAQSLQSKKHDFPAPAIVVAADTLVAMDQRVFPKPKDLEEAHAFLETLGGRPHQVYTGVFLHHLQSGQNLTFYDETHVTLANMSRATREKLFLRMNPLDKAGAYGAQDAPDIIEKIHGHRSNVIGLPMEALAEHLQRLLDRA